MNVKLLAHGVVDKVIFSTVDLMLIIYKTITMQKWITPSCIIIY